MNTLIIRKKSLKTWLHTDSILGNFIISKFYFNADNVSFQIVEQGQSRRVIYNISDITVYALPSGGTAETFTTITELSLRLEELNYPAFQYDGQITSIANLIDSGTNVTITGDGTLASPYIISATGGGGGSQTLAETLVLGNITDGTDISISDGDAVILDNGSMLKKGTIDAGNGGAKGISQICAVGYEHKWEAGRLYIMNDGGTTIREVSHNFAVTPTITDDDTKGFAINSRWILDNGDIYVCTDATTGSAVWGLQSNIPNLRQVLTEGGRDVLLITNAYTLESSDKATTVLGVYDVETYFYVTLLDNTYEIGDEIEIYNRDIYDGIYLTIASTNTSIIYYNSTIVDDSVNIGIALNEKLWLKCTDVNVFSAIIINKAQTLQGLQSVVDVYDSTNKTIKVKDLELYDIDVNQYKYKIEGSETMGFRFRRKEADNNWYDIGGFLNDKFFISNSLNPSQTAVISTQFLTSPRTFALMNEDYSYFQSTVSINGSSITASNRITYSSIVSTTITDIPTPINGDFYMVFVAKGTTTIGGVGYTAGSLVYRFYDGSWTSKDFGAGGVGTVTSVDLTMPTAFAVSGNPITTSGTLAVTAVGSASQYIRGDGQLATLPSNASGGSAVSYYLNGGTAASVATYYQMSKTAVIGTGVDFSLAGNGLISQWLTDVADPNRLEIPAGNWNFEMYMSASSSGGTPAFYVELLKYDGATFTTIANSSAVPEAITSGTIIDLYLTSLAIPQTTLLATDRLAVRVYIVNSTGGRTITMHTQDSHLCEIITNFAGGISALNGLTTNTQYLAVGTTGTDFAISSVTDTHTFNLPTASATNRGALSSADWSMFNSKAPLASPTFTGTVVLPSTTSIGTVSDTEIGYLDNVTSAIQTQINSKITQNAWVDYSASVTLVGWSSTSVKVIKYLIEGKKVTIIFSFTGTSNTTNITFSLPNNAGSSIPNTYGYAFGQNNGLGFTNASIPYVMSNSTVCTILRDAVGTLWTASGTKKTEGTIIYEIN